jgi:hypothetical protein
VKARSPVARNRRKTTRTPGSKEIKKTHPEGQAAPPDAQHRDGQQTRRNESTAEQGPPSADADQQQGDKTAGRQGEQSDSDPRGGAATGQGGQPGAPGSPSPSDGVVPEGDPANLDYARKQTDLVLDKLSDQLRRKQIDKNLLEQLGWSEDDLRRFVARWQERKAAAGRSDPAGEEARRELDEALRSLGLRPGSLRQGPIQDDTQRDLRQGFRGPVPREYQQRLRTYNEGVSRARQDRE